MTRNLMVLLFIVTVFLLSGCNLIKSPGELIEPPKLYDEQKINLQSKIQQVLPSEIELMTAKQDKKKQSIFIGDFNADNKLEAFVLYRKLDSERFVHLLILQEDNQGEWKGISDIQTNYESVDYFAIQDLDGEGAREIVLGLGATEFESKKQLNILKWEDEKFTNTIDRSYEGIDIADYDADGLMDILLIDGKRRESYTAELYSYSHDMLLSRSTVNLNPLAFHQRLESGLLNDGQHALFIDSVIGVHNMLTEILAFQDGELQLIGEEKDSLLKNYSIFSRDINNDGIIEVAETLIPKGWEEFNISEIPFIESYFSYSIDGNRTKVAERYSDRDTGFYIDISPSWYGKLTIQKSDNKIEFISITDENIVFELRWAHSENNEPSGNILGKTKNTLFYTTEEERPTFPYDTFYLIEDEF